MRRIYFLTTHLQLLLGTLLFGNACCLLPSKPPLQSIQIGIACTSQKVVSAAEFDMFKLKCWVWNPSTVDVRLSGGPIAWDVSAISGSNLVAVMDLDHMGLAQMPVDLHPASLIPAQRGELWGNGSLDSHSFTLRVPLTGLMGAEPPELALLRVKFFSMSDLGPREACGHTLIRWGSGLDEKGGQPGEELPHE